jgi:hypothetical protein
VREFTQHAEDGRATAEENGGGRDDEQYDEDEEDYDPTDMTAEELQRCEQTIAIMNPILSLVITSIKMLGSMPQDVEVDEAAAAAEADGSIFAGAGAGDGAGAKSKGKSKQTVNIQWGESMATSCTGLTDVSAANMRSRVLAFARSRTTHTRPDDPRNPLPFFVS